VITQGGVGIVLLEAVLHHLDQLGSLDGLVGISGKNVRKDFFELVAKIHEGNGRLKLRGRSKKAGGPECGPAFFIIQTTDPPRVKRFVQILDI
jgi:hypothetical protein